MSRADEECEKAKARSPVMFFALLAKFLVHLASILVGILTLPFLLFFKWVMEVDILGHYVGLLSRDKWTFYWSYLKDGPPTSPYKVANSSQSLRGGLDLGFDKMKIGAL